MTTKNIGMRTKDFELIDMAKDVFLMHHPYLDKIMVSNRKIIFEALKYYIKTEPTFRHKIGDKYDK